MSRMATAFRCFLLCLVGIGCFELVGACQTIAGIEERRLGPCGDYCDSVMAACQGDRAVYASYAACIGVCRLLPEGSPLEPKGSNSVACRVAEARDAAAAEPDVHCPNAGPGGGEACGSDCESYCYLYQAACGAEWFRFPSTTDCVRQCAALRDRHAFNAVSDHDGDTLQCRLVHVSSSTVEPAQHCEHARLAPPKPPCNDPASTVPDCAQYCHVLGIACQDTYAQYDAVSSGRDACVAACETTLPGTIADTDVNTRGCRLYHAYNALMDPTHCYHAGPTGDGHCGRVTESNNALCESYCQLVGAACPTDAAAVFQTASCPAVCAAWVGATPDAHYSVKKGQAGGNTLDCRMYYAVHALAGDVAACGAALGAAPCQ